MALKLYSARGNPASERREGSLEVIVLHSSTMATLESLKRAAELAAGLAAHIRLLVATVVPYPLPLESPQVPLGFASRKFMTIGSEARIETIVDIRLGRYKRQMIEEALKPHSLVVLHGEKRLGRRLERMGHHVIYSTPRVTPWWRRWI